MEAEQWDKFLEEYGKVKHQRDELERLLHELFFKLGNWLDSPESIEPFQRALYTIMEDKQALTELDEMKEVNG